MACADTMRRNGRFAVHESARAPHRLIVIGGGMPANAMAIMLHVRHIALAVAIFAGPPAHK